MGHLDNEEETEDARYTVRIWWTVGTMTPETFHGCTNAEADGEHQVMFEDNSGKHHEATCSAYEVIDES